MPARGGPDRLAPIPSYSRRLHQSHLQPCFHVAVLQRTNGQDKRASRANPPGTHARRFDVHQRPRLYSRSAGGLRWLGGGRQHWLGLLRYPALLQAFGAQDRDWRRRVPWPRGRADRYGHGLDSPWSARPSSQGRRGPGCRETLITTAPFQEGVGYYQRTIHNGWRQSAARSFLHPVKNRRNLELRTNAQATAIVLDGKRAAGIRYVRGKERDRPREVRARREGTPSSGSINTPRLLQISGIGPAYLLQSLGIPVCHELGAVGENLRDHFSVRMVARVKNSLTLNEIARGPRLAAQIARWMIGRPNILAVSPSLVHWFSKSREGLNTPDIQGVFTPASYREGYPGTPDNYPGMTCGVWQHRPESTGFVRARSSDPFQDPIIQPNYLKDRCS